MLKADPKPTTPRERIMAASRLQAETGGDPSTFRVATDDELCVIFGFTPDELRELREMPTSTFTVTSIDRTAGTLTFDPSPAVYSGPLGALKPVHR